METLVEKLKEDSQDMEALLNDINLASSRCEQEILQVISKYSKIVVSNGGTTLKTRITESFIPTMAQQKNVVLPPPHLLSFENPIVGFEHIPDGFPGSYYGFNVILKDGQKTNYSAVGNEPWTEARFDPDAVRKVKLYGD